MSYRVTIKKSAAKELENLPKKVLILVTQSISNLSDNPEIKIVDIKKVGHRRDIYD